MKTIASFMVDHDRLTKGMYISRVDGDVMTYDIRMAVPNVGPYLEPAQSHTFEHLFATYARNSAYSDQIVYVGPMGCRTGFYLLTRDSLTHQQALDLMRESLDFIRTFQGEIPGAQTSAQCGNYKEHDLQGARAIAEMMANVLQDWTVEQMDYAH